MTKAKRQIGVLLTVWVILSIFGGITFMQASAATVYSDVLTDLSKDNTFTVSAYPEDPNSTALELIQIAESDMGELFVYTYQPSQKTVPLTATSINISVTTGDELRYSNYRLKLLSASGVFCKYIVMGFGILSTPTRVYDISSIYRKWDSAIDAPSGNDNTVNEVAYSVGKRYCAETVNGKVEYYTEDTEVITILNPYVDFLEYSNGFKLCPTWCRSHYIAFTTDKPIDILMEADVFYVRREATRVFAVGVGEQTYYGDGADKTVTLTGKQTASNPADGFRGKKYTWERIQSVEKFKSEESLSEEILANLSAAKWVLRFTETEIRQTGSPQTGSTTTYFTDISNVSVLRLKFMTKGKLYNLGTVSDKITGDDKPGNTNRNELASFWEWLARKTGLPEWFWIALAILIPLAILLPILAAIFPVVGQILSAVLKGIGTAFVWLCKGLFFLICLPFKGVAALIEKIKERKAV